MRWLQSLHTQWTLHLVMQGEERRRKRRMVLQTSASVNRFLLLNSIPPHDKEEQQHHQKTEDGNTEHRALKSFHNRSKYYKPLHGYNNKTKHSGRFTLGEDDRGISIGNNGVSYRISADAPFEFQFSYSETPKVKPLALREPPYVPFGPTTMPRPWTGGPPLTKKKKNLPGFGSNLNTPRKEVEQAPQHAPTPTRAQILGHPLTEKEVDELLQSCCHTNRQVNLGRDGLTHNMLELVHEHWRRRSVCKIKCKGVPTVDMDNVCYHLEEKTGGKIIRRAGGVVYLFRGRNYNHKTRPRFPLMLWKPAAPIYPKLIERAPGGLTKEQADKFRKKGRHLLSICKLAKNGVYITLVNDVREAFEENELVRINCEGMNPSDYKKIGAKLKDLVPCVLLSFDKEHILMWRGKDWKSKNADQPSAASTQEMEMM